jgi:predicted RNA polymerase sigma factor
LAPQVLGVLVRRYRVFDAWRRRVDLRPAGRGGAGGPHQLQSAIAAVHDEAPSTDDTDWLQIVLLYELLLRSAPNPMAGLNHAVAVAVAMVDGPRAGLDLLGPLAADDRLADHHRLHAVRAHLPERAGDDAAARASYREAARRTTSLPQQRYLEARAARLAPPPD